MKLKQVTFAEALEVMKGGKYALNSTNMKYRINGESIQANVYRDAWKPTGNNLSDALEPWFIEVEPMKTSYETTADSAGTLSYRSLGDGWEYKRVRVTVEEI